MTQKLYVISFFCILAVSLLVDYSWAQPAPKLAPKEFAERTYSRGFDHVWDIVIEVLTEQGLSENPLSKMSVNKESGKIVTPTFRYFQVFSARPVVENDYRDSYSVTVSSESKAMENEAKAKEAKAEAKIAEAKEKTGEEGKALMEEAKKLAAEGEKEAGEARAAAAKPMEVTVQIQRKFEMYNSEKKAWVDADPAVEKVGITAEALLDAIDANMASPTTEKTDPFAVPHSNLTLNPPIFTNDYPKQSQSSRGGKIGSFFKGRS